MTEQPLRVIYEKLLSMFAVESQLDFGTKLGYTEGYISEALNKKTISPKMRKKLHEQFSISTEWLASNGKQGRMIEPIIPPPNKAENSNKQNDENQEIGTGFAVDSTFTTNQKYTPMEDRLLSLLERMEVAREKDQELRAKDQQIIAHLTGAAGIIHPNRQGKKGNVKA